MKKMTAAQVMKVLLDRYQFVRERDDSKLYDDDVRQDELIVLMREILDKQSEIEGFDEDDDFQHDLMEQASELGDEYSAIEQQVGCFEEEHF